MIDFINDKLADLSYSYHMLIIEDDAKLYLDKECQQEIGEMDQYNYKMIKVVTQEKVEGVLTVLIEVKGELAGWFQPKTSIMLYHKPFEHVLVDIPQFKSPEINRLMNNGADLSLAFMTYHLTSRYFTVHNGQQIEALYTGNRFLGFAPSDVLSRSTRLNDEATLTMGMYKVYGSPKRDDNGIDVQFDAEQPVNIVEVFPSQKIVKIKQGVLTGWVDTAALNGVSYNDTEKALTTEQMMIEHLIETYMTERNNHRTIIKKLVNESMTLRKRLVKIDKSKERTEQLYQNLRQSKLGKIQIAIWERRARGGRKK